MSIDYLIFFLQKVVLNSPSFECALDLVLLMNKCGRNDIGLLPTVVIKALQLLLF